MKILKLLILSAAIFIATVGASQGAPASITPATSKPKATYPTNGSLVTSYTSILFTWTASAGTGGTYDIDIATDSAFSSIISFDHGTGSNSFHSFGPFLPARNYYWRVQAYDIHAVPSGWVVFAFRTSVKAPSLIRPGPGSTLDNNRTNDIADDTSNNPVASLFSWSSITSAGGYTLQVSQSATFNSFVINVNLPYTITTYTPTTDLPANTILYWRVETLNSAYGPSVWAPFWSFTTANPPSIPTSLKPENGKVDNDFTPGLSWQAVALPGGTSFVAYDVQISTDKQFQTPTARCFNDLSATTLSKPALDVQNATLPPPGTDCPTFSNGGITSLQPATTYYWRLRAVDTKGWSDWSSVNTLLMSYPQVDSAKFSPPTGTTLTTNFQTFSWHRPFVGTSAVPGTFGLQIFRNPYFRTGGVVNITINGPSYTPGPRSPLPACTTLYWRVRAGSTKSLYGTGLWSNTATVFTACPPSALAPYSPKSGTVVLTAMPTLQWRISTVPFIYPFTYYWIQITPDISFSYFPPWDMVTSRTNPFTSSFTLTTPLPSHGT